VAGDQRHPGGVNLLASGVNRDVLDPELGERPPDLGRWILGDLLAGLRGEEAISYSRCRRCERAHFACISRQVFCALDFGMAFQVESSQPFMQLWLCRHPWEPTKRSERAERDQLEAHKMGLAERQLLEHLMGGGGISDVQDEHHPLAVLLRVPLIDLAIQIEVCGIPNLLWQHSKDFLRFDAGIDGSDSEDFCGRCRLHGDLSVSSRYAGEAKHDGETGGESVLHTHCPTGRQSWSKRSPPTISRDCREVADATFIGFESQEKFTPFDLTNLPNYHIYVRLMIYGTLSIPFSAETLAPGL
jgi:hypothetical protein